MAITLRTTKGTALTYEELDANFSTLESNQSAVEIQRIINDQYVTEIIDSAYIRRKQSYLDSATISGFIDSAYIRSKQAYLDSAAVIDLIDSAYIRAKETPINTQLQNVSTNILPDSNLAYDLGSSTKRWNDIWLASSTIHLGDTSLSVDNGDLIEEERFKSFSDIYDAGVDYVNVFGETENGIQSIDWLDSEITVVVTDTYQDTVDKIKELYIGSTVQEVSSQSIRSANVAKVATGVTETTGSGTITLTFDVDSARPTTTYPSAWSGNITGQDFDNLYLATNSLFSTPYDLYAIDEDKIFVLNATNGRSIHQINYDSSDITTGTITGNFTLTGDSSDVFGMHIDPNGEYLFTVNQTTGIIRKYTFGTPKDVTTLTEDTSATYAVTEDNEPRSVTFSPDGDYMFIAGNQNKTVYQYELSTGWDLSTASHGGTTLDMENIDGPLVNPGDSIADLRHVRFNPNGQQMVISTSTGRTWYASIASPGAWANGTGIAGFQSRLWQSDASYTQGAGFDYSDPAYKFFQIDDGGLQYIYQSTTNFSVTRGGSTTTIPQLWVKKVKVKTAAQLPFTPNDSADWGSNQPTTVEDALNRMSALLRTLNSGPIP